MSKKLVDDVETEPISPLIDVVANAMAAMFIMLVIYMALTEPPPECPIVYISEAEGLRFASGSADLSEDSRQLVEAKVAPILAEQVSNFGCNIVDVIGHTDGQALRTTSNLDRELDVRSDTTAALVAGSNTDLGLLRAWSVIRVLKQAPVFARAQFYGYSAGQTVLPTGELAARDSLNEAARRRIEIRLRRAPLTAAARQ